MSFNSTLPINSNCRFNGNLYNDVSSDGEKMRSFLMCITTFNNEFYSKEFEVPEKYFYKNMSHEKVINQASWWYINNLSSINDFKMVCFEKIK